MDFKTCMVTSSPGMLESVANTSMQYLHIAYLIYSPKSYFFLIFQQRNDTRKYSKTSAVIVFFHAPCDARTPHIHACD